MTRIIDKLFDGATPGINKMLDLTYRRNEAISSNIANAETPMYRAVDMTFAGELKRAFNYKNAESLKTTNSKHMDLKTNSSAHLVPDYSGATKADGNNVDIDIQMGKLSANSGKYRTAASLIRKKLHMMRMAIRYSMR